MKNRKFSVTWTIDLCAASPLGAASVAQEIHLDTKSIASVFEVSDGESKWVVDLLAPRRRRVRRIQPRRAER